MRRWPNKAITKRWRIYYRHLNPCRWRRTRKTLYKLRKQTVEPVFGIIKSVLGFRQFLLRGREKVALEWLLVCVSYNFKRLFTLKNLLPAG